MLTYWLAFHMFALAAGLIGARTPEAKPVAYIIALSWIVGSAITYPLDGAMYYAMAAGIDVATLLALAVFCRGLCSLVLQSLLGVAVLGHAVGCAAWAMYQGPELYNSIMIILSIVQAGAIIYTGGGDAGIHPIVRTRGLVLVPDRNVSLRNQEGYIKS